MRIKKYALISVILLIFLCCLACQKNYSLNVETETSAGSLSDTGKDFAATPADGDSDVVSGVISGETSGNEKQSDQMETSEDEPLREFNFQTAEEWEDISEDDLIYLLYHSDEYGLSYFIDLNPEENQYDTFGIPLLEWEFEGMTKREKFDRRCIRPNIPYEEMNIEEPFPEDVFRKYAYKFCEDIIRSADNWDNDSKTGKRVKDDEIIFCGEDDMYLEYSVRYTEVRSYYSNNVRVTNEIPRATRFLFDKGWITVENDNKLYPAYFGEYTMEKRIRESDLSLSNGYYPVFYREFEETEDEIITTYYGLEISGGDYGMYDYVRLVKYVITYDKENHEEFHRENKIKEVAIPGTYHDWGM